MTDNEYLEAVLREQTLAPGGSELKQLQELRKEVEGVLRGAFGDAPKIREGGSKAKGTMIKDSYDLDLTCYFPHEDNTAGETLSDIYDAAEDALAEDYSTIRKGSAIRIHSLDGDADLHVDVVPGRFVDGEDGDVFLHRTNGDKQRLKTNLDVHIAYVKGSGVRDAIRLMKLWRERNGIDVKTFVLELLVIDLLAAAKDDSLVDQLIKLWESLRDTIDDLKVQDPANPDGNDLTGLFDDTVKSQLSSTASQTLQAIEDSGWSAVFGEVDDDEEGRTEAMGRIAASTPVRSKPWARRD